MHYEKTGRHKEGNKNHRYSHIQCPFSIYLSRLFLCVWHIFKINIHFQCPILTIGCLVQEMQLIMSCASRFLQNMALKWLLVGVTKRVQDQSPSAWSLSCSLTIPEPHSLKWNMEVPEWPLQPHADAVNTYSAYGWGCVWLNLPLWSA